MFSLTPEEGPLPPYSDKAILPPSVLSEIIESVPELSLPHPLLFKITNGTIATYVGVKEFSAPDSTIQLPKRVHLLFGNSTDNLSVELASVPQATSITLKPLHNYNVENWKFFLENKLNKYYTTLTSGDTLVLEDDLRYELSIEEINGKSENFTACIIDTDITLEIVPLNDQIASEQLKQFKSNPYNNIIEVEQTIDVPVLKSMNDPTFVPVIYKVDLTKYPAGFQLKLETETPANADVIAGLDKFVNLENFFATTMDQDLVVEQGKLAHKTLTVNITDAITNKLARIDEDDMDAEKWVYFTAFSWSSIASITITVGKIQNHPVDLNHESESTCSNCLQPISQEKLLLHESFCLRNNVRCLRCDSVFLRQIPPEHWHCDHDSFFTNMALSRDKHLKLHHQGPYNCSKCSTGASFPTFIDLVTLHQATDCPEKLHQCQFCHLILAQGEYTYQDRFENLTNHENTCGNRTNECYKCSKVVRVKDMKKHMKMHELDKITFNERNKVSFNKCSNENCTRLVGPHNNELNLCDLCFGPIYVNQHDPTHIKLQQRIERKYMMQLTKGCGQTWCTNEYCLSNPRMKGKLFKELMELLNTVLFKYISTPPLPINKSNPMETYLGRNRFWFCVNESISTKTLLLSILQHEAQYNQEMIYKALNETTNESDARAWLQQHALAR